MKLKEIRGQIGQLKTSKTFYKNLKTSIKTYNKLNMRKENESKENKMKKKKRQNKTNNKQTSNKMLITYCFCDLCQERWEC